MRRPKSKSVCTHDRNAAREAKPLGTCRRGDVSRPIAQDPQVMRYVNNGELWSDAKVREFIARQMRHIAAQRLLFCENPAQAGWAAHWTLRLDKRCT